MRKLTRGRSTHSLYATIAVHWRAVVAAALLLGAGLGAAYLLWPRPPPPLAVVAPSPRPTASPVPFVAVHIAGAVAKLISFLKMDPDPNSRISLLGIVSAILSGIGSVITLKDAPFHFIARNLARFS